MARDDLPPLDPRKGSWDEQALNRRRFMEIGLWTSAGAGGLIVAGAGARFWIGDSFQPREAKWVEVGKAADLASGQVHRARYSMREKDAWRAMARTGILYVFSNDGTETEYTVLDATCTHAACNVHWKEEKNQFCCPCHDGCFSREGEVLSGPPTRPLRRLQTKIEAGVLFALI